MVQAEKVDVCNVIPAQKAGKIAELAGLTAESGWAPVKPADMRSQAWMTMCSFWAMPAHRATCRNRASRPTRQAKVVANVIRGELTGSRIFPARYSNTCWSLIATNDGVKVGANYEPTEEKIASVSSASSARRAKMPICVARRMKKASAGITGSSPTSSADLVPHNTKGGSGNRPALWVGGMAALWSFGPSCPKTPA
jgi:hypothetical protein